VGIVTGKKKISIIIAAINEEHYVGEVINSVKKYADEIVIVDGHSTDKTAQIAMSLGAKVVYDNGKGKGDAIRCGIQAATGDILVFIDADGSHDANDIPKMVAPIIEGRADMVIGSRGTGGSDELHGDIEKFLRMTGSGLILLLINYKFNIRLTDSQNGFRAIRRSVALDLNLKENITTIEQEMLVKCLKRGYKVSEVPAHEYARKHGRSRISLRKMSFWYVYSVIKYLYFWRP
jgi:glycosyltransferase involved in cell wall biosynthesis